MEESIKNRQVVNESELNILHEAITTDDASVLEKLDPTITAYERLLADALATPAPEELVNDHLLLVNSYQAILSDVKAMRFSFDDPLYGMVRTRRYESDILSLNTSLSHIYTYLYTAGVRYTGEEAGALFRIVESE